MSLRSLPSVDRLLLQSDRLIARYGRPLTLSAMREAVEAARESIRAGQAAPGEAELLRAARERLEDLTTPSLRPVINATGVILHTNLGRAPLSRAALQAMHAAAEGYSTLEYDLARGDRGSRTVHAERLLVRLTGAEAALVVNNNAGAVLLALTALAKGRGVLISRSQLVEIGGGFRVPDVMKQSGAKLVEVGTTNRTHLRDFEAAIGDKTALVLRAHHSNFRIIGFTAEPTLKELCDLAHRRGLAVLDDLGSGAVLDTAAFGLGHEPTVQESLAAGADVVAFSGDKLLGGPQAGVLVGRAEVLARLKVHPLARALRADKLCLAALSATLLHYLRDEAAREIPIWRMIAAPPAELDRRAAGWAAAAGNGRVVDGRSAVGGGSLPEETLPTRLWALDAPRPARLVARLRAASLPVIARIEDDRVVLDPRSVLPEQDGDLLRAVQEALA